MYIYISHTHTHTHTMEYYSATRKNKILALATMWMDLEGIVLSEISQTEKHKYCMKSHVEWVWERGGVLGVSSSVCLVLFNPVDCSPPGSSVHGIPARKEGKDIAKCTAHLFPFLVDCC